MEECSAVRRIHHEPPLPPTTTTTFPSAKDDRLCTITDMVSLGDHSPFFLNFVASSSRRSFFPDIFILMFVSRRPLQFLLPAFSVLRDMSHFFAEQCFAFTRCLVVVLRRFRSELSSVLLGVLRCLLHRYQTFLIFFLPQNVLQSFSSEVLPAMYLEPPLSPGTSTNTATDQPPVTLCDTRPLNDVHLDRHFIGTPIQSVCTLQSCSDMCTCDRNLESDCVMI